jgi:hypothetical protein
MQLYDRSPSPDFRAECWRVGNREGSQPLFGLVRLTAQVYSRRSLSDATLDVCLGPVSAPLPIADVGRDLGDSRWSIVLHVVTHLVPNGRYEMNTFIRWPDGPVQPLASTALEIENAGILATQVRHDLYAHGTPAILGRIVDSGLFPYGKGKAKAWFDQADDDREVPLSLNPSTNNADACRHLIRWGFAILGDIVPGDIVNGLNIEVDRAIADGSLMYRAGSSDRIRFTHRLPHGRKIWLYPPVIEFLRTWFQDEPCACQTLYYIHGSEQGAHQDTIHLTPFPAGYMCGVWVPLEDVQPESGELFIYPGSHRAPRLLATPLGLHKVEADDYSHYAKFEAEIERLLKVGGYERVPYRPKAGQILVWHENLIHGGHQRLNRSITRRSIVSHYFARGCIAYYDSRGEAAGLERLD